MRTLLPLLLLLSGCTLDPDQDGLGRRQEKAAGTDPKVDDTDGDGIDDGAEAAAGTDPLSADTDGDGVDDGAEVQAGTDPLDADSDDDGLSDGAEAELGTDPMSVDSDGDRIGDRQEVEEYGTDPLDADTDDDGLDDGDDADAGADPLDPDTDDDFVLDGDEADLGTGVLDPDSDLDGYLDGDEVLEGTDPTDALDRIYEGRWPYRRDKDDLEPPPEPLTLTVGERVPRWLLSDVYGQDVDLWDLTGAGAPIVLHLGPDDEASAGITALRQAGEGDWAPVASDIADGSLVWARVLLPPADAETEPTVEDLNRWYAAFPDRRVVPLAGSAEVRAWAAEPATPLLVVCDADLTVVASGGVEVIEES